MGMLTATGGGVIRDVLTNTPPMILSAGELYATAALGGAFVGALTIHLHGSALLAQVLGLRTVLILRAASITVRRADRPARRVSAMGPARPTLRRRGAACDDGRVPWTSADPCGAAALDSVVTNPGSILQKIRNHAMLAA